MALRILPPEAHRVMPWKNGGGTTTELLILPEGATLANGFDLRISRAQVSQSGPFSPFPGHDRTLLLLRGGPLSLALDDGTTFLLDRPLVPIRFSGDRAAMGRLQGAPCEDFNVITQRSVLSHRLDVLEGEGPFPLPQAPTWTLWYVVEGVLGGAEAGSLLWVDDAEHPPLQGSPQGRYLRIAVTPRTAGG